MIGVEMDGNGRHGHCDIEASYLTYLARTGDSDSDNKNVTQENADLLIKDVDGSEKHAWKPFLSRDFWLVANPEAMTTLGTWGMIS